MIDERVREAAHRVETASLQGLGQIDIDEVQVAMDALLAPDVEIASLYRRWERQQWAVSDLDFARDRTDWGMLPPPVSDTVRSTMTLFFIGEQAVTDTLAPILHAAPTEDERIFLATQVADEARHTVFFQQFFEHVLGMSGGLSAALAALRPRTRQGFRAIFDTHLASTTDLVRQNPGDAEAWVRAVVTYHLIVEGYLALTGQRTLLRVLRNASLLPGFYAGFTAVARDESRHLGFGVAALRRRIQKDPAMAGIILDQLHLLIEPAVHTVVGPDQQLPFEDPHEIPEPMRVGPYEVRGFAQGSLRKRLQALGIEQSAIEELELRGNRIFEDAWTRYEQVHRVRHPVRFYDNSGTLLAG